MSAVSAWSALARSSWADARAGFEAALAETETPELLEGYSWALWWDNLADETLATRQRAYACYRSGGDQRGAARMAMWLAADFIDFRCDTAISSGWIRRARRCLEGVDLAPEHGWLALHEGTLALDLAGDAAEARERGLQCTDVGRRTGDLDVEMLGQALAGLAAVHVGDVHEGLRQLDEAATAALAGDLREKVSVGWACCSLIKACETVRDYDRAAQWSEQMVAFARAVGFEPWVRICRTFHAWVLVCRGRWAEAEEALLTARERLAATRPPWTVEAVVRLAELRRRQGRLDEAAELFATAGPHPAAQVGLGAIALDRGDAASAIGAAERAIRATTQQHQTVDCLIALELRIEAHVARGDVEEAAAALEHLHGIATGVATTPVRASYELHAGLVAGVAGDADAARRHLENATDLFVTSGSPYEAALARLELSRVLARLGDWPTADGEVSAALDALTALGAAVALARARDLQREFAAAARARAARSSRSPTLTGREREILALVGEGLSDREVAATLVLSEHTVHRHVANILRKLGVPSRTAAVRRATTDQLL